MEVTIKGSAKEIAALALELQERQGNGISLQKAREIARKVQKYDNHKASSHTFGSSEFQSSSSGGQ